MTAVDLAARRRQSVTRDAQAVMADIAGNVTTLHATVAGWPYRYFREDLIAEGERQLDAISGLLRELRGMLPTTPQRAA